MLHQKRKYLVENWNSKFPKNGTQTYIIGGNTYLNTVNKIRKEFKKRISIEVKPRDDNDFSRTVELKISEYELKLEPKLSTLEEILLLTSSIYEKVNLRVKYDGSILDVENELQIKQCWNDIKEKLNKDYQGSSIRRFINNIEYTLSSKKHIIENLLGYELFGMLFNPIYKNHDSTKPLVINKNKRISGGMISVEEKFIIEDVDKENNTVKLNLKGKLKSKDIEYSGYYKINEENSWIKSVNIEIEEGNNKSTFWLKENK